jgi:glycosyltransferase involved in cell wall biosynthesis
MRVAFAGTPDLGLGPDPQFAVGLLTRAIALRLLDRGEVTIYRSDQGHDAVDAQGIRYRAGSWPSPWYGKPLSVLDRFSARPAYARHIFATPLYYPRYIARLAASLSASGADVLHLHNFFQAIPAIRARNPALTIVLHMHCEWLDGVDRAFAESRLAGADLILGCSEYLSRRIRARFPQYAQRVRTLMNGVDLDCFRPAAVRERADRPRIVFAGRVSPEKGLHVLLDAMRYVVDAFPNARLELIGPDAAQPAHYLAALRNPLVDPNDPDFAPLTNGHYAGRLRAKARAELAGRVIFSIGSVPQDELTFRFSHATLLVNPSLVETFGMTILEAMANGLPVVATTVGGIPELVRDGETGLLVATNDPRALGAAICAIIRDPERARAMGARARQIAESEFGWDRITACYAELLDTAIEIRVRDPQPAIGLPLVS